MTTSDFFKLLHNPNQINDLSYDVLDQLLLQFPYCNGVRMLQLKKFKEDKHIAFERHLTLASTYASDRGKLYNFVNKPLVANPDVISINKTLSAKEKKTKILTKLVQPPPVFSHKVSDNPPSIVFKQELEVQNAELAYNLFDTHKSDSGLSLMPVEEWLQDFEPPRIEKEKSVNNKKAFKLSRVPLFDKTMFDFLETESPDKKSVSGTKKNITKKNPSTHKHIDKKGPESDIVSETEKLFSAISESNILTNDNNDVLNPDDNSESIDNQEENVTESPDILETFLSKTDNFLKSLGGKGKSKEYPSSDSLKDESTIANEDIVSETLADLLALQGQNIKAIKMYKTLSLKFPEKSRFFAEKIEELI
jgi:hypothetical protein